MLIPKACPDEFISGYQGRLRILNGFGTTAAFMVALREAVHPRRTRMSERPSALTLARASFVPLRRFIRSHTLLPFFRAVTMSNSHIAHGDPSRLNLIDVYGNRRWRASETWFCRDCVSEDLATWGYAYWRRSHQLPGVCWCPNHGSQLAYSSMGKRAFDEMPSIEMTGGYEFSEQQFIAIRENSAVKRYAEIVFAFLDSERPVDLAHARYGVAERAMQRKLQIGRRGRLPTVTDQAMHEFPKEWLLAQYERANDNSSDELPVENLIVGRASAQGYALALAVLFDSSIDALNYLSAYNTDGSSAEDSSSTRNAIYRYPQPQISTQSISEPMVPDPIDLFPGLKKTEWEDCDAIEARPLAQAIIDFQGGMSLDDACRSNEVSTEAIEELLRSRVVKFREGLREIAMLRKILSEKLPMSAITMQRPRRTCRPGQNIPREGYSAACHR